MGALAEPLLIACHGCVFSGSQELKLGRTFTISLTCSGTMDARLQDGGFQVRFGSNNPGSVC